MAMLQYTPGVALFRHDAVVLEVSASLSLFGGIRSLVRQVTRSAVQVKTGLRLGMAPSATGAWLLAGNRGVRRVVRVSSLQFRLARLPFWCLPETQPHHGWLQRIGCRQLGCLRKLPRSGLQQRTTPELLQALDAAYAERNEPLVWFTPPPHFRQALEPDFHLEHAQTVLVAVRPLLQALCGWLHANQQALHDFVLLLHHEKGPAACPPTRLALRFSSATWSLHEFHMLLKERLLQCFLPCAVIRLELVAGVTHPRNTVSDTLFPDPARRADDEQRLLDLLAARLGEAAICHPVPRAHHLPEQVNIWQSAVSSTAPKVHCPAGISPATRPFWLLAQPRPLEMRQERPFHQGHPLRLLLGPERLETGWWSELGHQQRDYFVAEDPEGARYWVYRERETGEGWFLHGLFG